MTSEDTWPSGERFCSKPAWSHTLPSQFYVFIRLAGFVFVLVA